jgi:DNA polymerase-4
MTGRTVGIKVRHHDFTTVTRAITRDQPTDDPRLVAQLARRLLTEIDTSGGIRLLGVGVSTLAGFAQDDLFSTLAEEFWSVPVPAGPLTAEEEGEVHNPVAAHPSAEPAASPGAVVVSSGAPAWRPGQDVWHDEHGAGWVWGSGLGRVTVRFEGPNTTPGPVRTFAADDPSLRPADPPDWTY